MADAEAPKEKPKEKKASPVKWIVLLVVLVAAAIGVPRALKYFDSYETTDDAQIDGDIYSITSRITGTIKAVHIRDNDAVKAGQLLVELDPRDYDVSIQQAEAALYESQTAVTVAKPNVPITSVSTETILSTAAADIASARASLAAAEGDYKSAVADIRKAEADNVKAQGDVARYKQLIAKDEISQQVFDQAQATANAAAANVDAKSATAEALSRAIDEQKARLEQAQTRALEAQRNRPQQIAIQNAVVESKVAAAQHERTLLEAARLNRSYTLIFAPADGIIGKKSAEPGQQVAPGQQLMSVVSLEKLWVTANFKETQMKKVKPGQRVTLHVDAYEKDYEGVVENLAGASGARFSLLPPENATGNYVKVVQRLPVRIRFKEGQDPEHALRPGMSVTPKILFGEP